MLKYPERTKYPSLDVKSLVLTHSLLTSSDLPWICLPPGSASSLVPCCWALWAWLSVCVSASRLKKCTSNIRMQRCINRANSSTFIVPTVFVFFFLSLFFYFFPPQHEHQHFKVHRCFVNTLPSNTCLSKFGIVENGEEGEYLLEILSSFRLIVYRCRYFCFDCFCWPN